MEEQKKKRSLYVYIFLFACFAGACGALAYILNIEEWYGHKLRVEEAYFYDNRNLAVSEDNPYFDDIVTAVQELSELETIEPTSWCHPTRFSLVTKDNVRFEIFNGMDNLTQPNVEGYYADPIYALGVRVIADGVIEEYFYDREQDEPREVGRLLSLAYVHVFPDIGTIEGIIQGMGEDDIMDYLYLVTEDYGKIHVYVLDLHDLKQGDRVTITFPKKQEKTAEYGWPYGVVKGR